MKDLRNPIKREKEFNHPAGNVMMELKEADLNNFVAGGGQARNSGGVLCTSTAECYYGTLLKPCCPKK
ncbi:MAG: plantaricin C family lantibiotic [Clostridium butyricum]|uniref:plantaricin C family lantibiotic n=1 Tax=Clostridium sp. TaxID=1506 RepID=UPI0029044F24|nr:plantaricin C family lantibiotic [Clostridium sp.]MDU1007051.1 plantaricin C family lantibiotic [Clostridium butyricum]MDU1117080.1 plantaricin C family lantibiotic [Clostridium sp.]MDU4853543.1 plantaricin C family lantibiotic [Clostridioides difficile]MDU7713404.1 plantaricin C family lantibiotic [Clostridium butyricum]